MAWPEKPETPLDLPLELYDENLVATFEVPTPGAGQALCEYIGFPGVRERLEAITGGDEAKEKMLGQILFTLAYRAASFATPEDLKKVRYIYAGVDMDSI